jgi:hypothetical protein
MLDRRLLISGLYILDEAPKCRVYAVFCAFRNSPCFLGAADEEGFWARRNLHAVIGFKGVSLLEIQ